MDTIINALTALTPLVSMLVGTGLLVKYVPVLSKIPNEIIPLLNALIVFLTAFGPAPANAGIFGDFIHELSFPAKAIGSLAVSAIASSVYETFIRPTFERVGIKKA